MLTPNAGFPASSPFPPWCSENPMKRAITVGMLYLLIGCAPETDPLCANEVQLTYDSWGRGFLDTHCNGCHSSITAPAQRRGAPPGVDFDTYGGVLQWAERIEDRVLVAPDEERIEMPPGGGPTPEELSMLHEWLQCSVYQDQARMEGEE